MRLTCFAEDLELLQGVEPLDDGMYDEDELLDAHDDHARFLAERVELLDENGEQLKAKITNIGPFEIPETGIEQGSLMNYSLNYEFEFKYDEPPQFLTINQKLVAEGMILPSELEISLKQSGGEEIFHMMKPEAPEIFRFDWDRPPLSADATEEERNQHFAKEREQTLGITSYSNVYNFVYITDTEVRQEVLIPLASLSTFLEFDRADERFLEVEEQDAAKPLIEALFDTENNQVKIDGVPVPPVFDRIDFYGLDIRDFVNQSERERLSMANGRVGVIMSYSAKASPNKVEITWKTFNEVVKTIDSIIFEYDVVKQFEFSRFLVDNQYVWENPGRPPLPPITGIDASNFKANSWSIPWATCLLGLSALVLALFCRSLFGTGLALALAAVCGVGAFFAIDVWQYEIKDTTASKIDGADEIFSQLHKNVFRAFDYNHENDIYDALANSVDGEQLRELYLQVSDSLRVKEQGGAVARIDGVDFVEGEQVPPSDSATSPAFGYRAKWNLIGTIEHWGHLHQRTNQYDAMFDVELVDDAWKITSMQIKDQVKGKIKTSVRKF